MAEVKLERKRGPTGVAAVVAVLALVLAVWWIMRSDTAADVIADGSDAIAGETAVATAGGAIVRDDLPPSVETFLAWSDDARADSAMTPGHQYTVTGIRNLAAALEALSTSGQGAHVSEELRILRSRVDTLQVNPASTQHADQVRAVFRSLAGLMTAMQQERFPELTAEVQAVERAAEAVRADRQLLDQRAAVGDFFTRAAVAVRGMAGQR